MPPASTIGQELGLSKSAFIDFTLLLGTDFTQRIRGLGPVRAIKHIRQFESIERILAEQDQLRFELPIPREEYLEQILAARKIFETPPPLPTSQSFEQQEPDDQKVQEVLQHFNLTQWVGRDEKYGSAVDGSLFYGTDSSLGKDYFNNPDTYYY